MLEQLKKQCYALQGKKHSISGDSQDKWLWKHGEWKCSNLICQISKSN